MSDRTCTMPDCDRPHRARGLCAPHYYRKPVDGRVDPSPIGPPRRVDQTPGATLISNVSYRGMHSRISRLRGPAVTHECFYCRAQATGWAYDHCDPQEKRDPRGYYYSSDMEHYKPLCQGCHTYLDKRYLQLRRV